MPAGPCGFISLVVGWGNMGGRAEGPGSPPLPMSAEPREHPASASARNARACEPTGPGTTHLAAAPWGGQGSPDAAVSVVCSGQLQGEAGGHGGPRGQRLLLEDELGSQVHLSGAHHDLRSREQGRLALVVVLQHLGTGRGSWWRWRGGHHVDGPGGRPGLSDRTELRGSAGPHSPLHRPLLQEGQRLALPGCASVECQVAVRPSELSLPRT